MAYLRLSRPYGGTQSLHFPDYAIGDLRIERLERRLQVVARQHRSQNLRASGWREDAPPQAVEARSIDFTCFNTLTKAYRLTLGGTLQGQQ
jgi:hypothetical protein